MRQCSIFTASKASACLILLGWVMIAPISANSVIVGGYIPELRRLTLTPMSPVSEIRGDGSIEVEIALIEIDNNLPNFEVVLDFSGPGGNDSIVSEVRLVAEGGSLGTGLTVPEGDLPEMGVRSGRFVWSPGPQTSATLKYRLKVLVVYAKPDRDLPPLYVSVNTPY